MLDPQHGVPIRTQKYFLTTVPEAFTGEDLIDWLMTKLKIKELVEALHIATILCKYGYFFHVGTCGPVIVREDRELYRMQAPYFWVSVNWNVTDVEYLVYLTKRSIKGVDYQSQQLSHEATYFADLRRKYVHQLEFVGSQAEAQLRVLKDRKKMDRAILESQEKAFWRVMRPKPNEICVHDEDIKLTLIQEAPLTLQDIKQRIKVLTHELNNRFRQRAFLTHTALCTFCEHEAQYDGFLRFCSPSNPWISDDTTFWDLWLPKVEIPSQARVQRWGLSLRELLSDPTGVNVFMKFCSSEFSQECLKFYLAARDLRTGPLDELKDKAEKIYKEHLVANAPGEVNIVDTVRSAITANLSNPTFLYCFDAEMHIYELMKKNSYPRFISSEFYKQLINSAPVPVTKKTGIFHFVKSSAASNYAIDFDDSEIYSDDPDGCVPTLHQQ
ncbi:hypothetical protein ACOME3_003704 [Neoechinorhynchus agilis]